MGPSSAVASELAPFGPAVHVAVDDVHVRYQTPTTDASIRRSQTAPKRAMNRLLGTEPRVVVRALAGISLVARAGEAVGIVGLNGSGKSTLLRVIAGLERPVRGQVLASSTPVLLGVNAAMQPELTGQQNVRLGCLAIGMTPAEVAAAYPGVVELAGIGTAIHHPMKSYSSGMAARLRFAIAAASNPEILLIDEALNTGDMAFKERSEEKMNALRAGAGCVFLVSHAAKTVEETCTRAVWLHQGRMVMDGDAYEVAQKYRWYAWNLAKGEEAKAAMLLEDALREGVDTAVQVIDPAIGVPARHAKGA